MTLPYGVISDPHYHRWDAFATTNADGLNSRLEIQLDATKEAAKAMKAAGCKHMLVAGDTFHVRGAISPSVLHFVTETYRVDHQRVGSQGGKLVIRKSKFALTVTICGG